MGISARAADHCCDQLNVIAISEGDVFALNEAIHADERSTVPGWDVQEPEQIVSSCTVRQGNLRQGALNLRRKPVCEQVLASEELHLNRDHGHNAIVGMATV